MDSFKKFFAEEKTTGYTYSSVQFDLPETISKRIIRWGSHHMSDDEVFQDPEDPSYGRENRIHVTVLYGIHDAKPDGVQNLVKNLSPFYIKLKSTSIFSCPKFDVLKLGVESEELHKLHNRLRSNLDVTLTFPDYKPHVTVVYLKKGEGEKYAGDDTFDGIMVKVDKLVFSSKEGFKKPVSLHKPIHSMAI